MSGAFPLRRSQVRILPGTFFVYKYYKTIEAVVGLESRSARLRGAEGTVNLSERAGEKPDFET